MASRLFVVTGGSSGIGAAVVSELAAEDTHVVSIDREIDSSIGHDADDTRIHRRVGDVADAAMWSDLAAAISDGSLGGVREVTGLVNAAGITYRARIGEVSRDEWDRVLAVNVTGPLLGIQALEPLMGSGAAIVNVGSLAGLNGHYPAAYTTSKWALRGLTHAAAQQLGPRGIRVNIVHPGFIETPMTASAPAEMLAAQLELTPLERVGSPEEVARTIGFLLSDAASFLTGAEVPVDGGASSSGGAKVVADRIART